MLKTPKKITNPMTIIAIFAVLSETSAAVSLPFLDNQDREMYVWFLISFPFYLLFLFFVTLNFNHRSLYSPSDFDKDKNFLKSLEKSEREKKRNESSEEQHGRSAFCVSSTVLFCEEPPTDTPRTHNTADPPLESGLNKLCIQHKIHLPASMSNLNIIDARHMNAKNDFVTTLEKIRQTNKQNPRLILFLANELSEVLLKQNVLPQRKQSKKNTDITPCIIYNVSTQNVTVLE